MSKRDPMDYSIEDINLYVAQPHGCSLAHVMALDFPAADYIEDGEQYWMFDTVYAWLERFHTAIHMVHKAASPEDFERFMQRLHDLMQRKEGL